MKNLYDTLTNKYEDIEKEDLRKIALELIYAIRSNNTKWDYISTMNKAIENINTHLFLEKENTFKEMSIV